MTGQVTAGTTTLFATPEHIGWNYLKINDPGNGLFTIEKVVRASDDQEIPLENMWLTHVTLPDGKEPVYENKLHFVDDFPSMNAQEYIITWKVKAGQPPKVVSIDGLPTSYVTEQVTSATVTFSKPIDASTFNHEDLTLRLQGGADIMNASVTVTPVDAYTFTIDLSPVTTGDGYYVLTVQAANIKDQIGIKGETGKNASWTQFLGAPVIERFGGLPAGLSGPPFTQLEIEFNKPLNTATLTPDLFSITHNGNPVEGTVIITHLSGDTLFTLSGLADFMTQDGYYSLNIDLTGIETGDGVAGLITQSINWRVDTTPPAVLALRPDASKGYDGQHYAEMELEFTEPVTNFSLDMIDLWKDGIEQPLSQLHVDPLDNQTWLLSQFRLLTYHEGNYTLQIHMEEITDSAGLRGTEIFEYHWTVNRDAPPAVQSLRIAPDLGVSDSDGVTSGKQLTAVMNVPESGLTVELYQNDNGSYHLLASRDNVPNGILNLPFNLPTGGHMKLEVRTINDKGNITIVSIPVYIDESPLTAMLEGLADGSTDTPPMQAEVVFSRAIQETILDANRFELLFNNQILSLPDLIITQQSDSVFAIDGLSGIAPENGQYTLRMQMAGLHKQISGIEGDGWIEASWQLNITNHAPIADAGDDLLINQTGTYNLDGSNSYDSDNDALSYQWYPPAGIVLNDETLVNPQFTITDSNVDDTYTFMLAVSDGLLVHTDKVDVIISLATDIDDTFDDNQINVYPNPSKGQLYISGSSKLKLIKMVDINGAVVLIQKAVEGNPIEVDVQGLVSGFYQLVLHLEDRVIVKKVVVNTP
jgi:hypothetical protein